MPAAVQWSILALEGEWDIDEEGFWEWYGPHIAFNLALVFLPFPVVILLKLAQRKLTWASESNLSELPRLPVKGEEDADGKITDDYAPMGKACRSNSTRCCVLFTVHCKPISLLKILCLGICRIPWFRNLWCTIWIFPFFLLFALWRQLVMHMTQVSFRLG